MSTETKKFKKVRLFRLAKQINVPIERLVEHLEATGHASALKGSGVNRSVATEDAYFELLDAFAEDLALAERVQRKRDRRQAELEDVGDGAEAPAQPAIEPVVVEEATLLTATEPTDEAPPPDVVEVVEAVVETAEPTIEEPVEDVPSVSAAQTVVNKVEVEAAEVEVEIISPESSASNIEDSIEDAFDATEVNEFVDTTSEDEYAGAEDILVEDVVEAPLNEEIVSQVEVEEVATDPDPVVDEETLASELTEAVIEVVDSEVPVTEEVIDPQVEEKLLTADRYNLQGTKVVGKIDLSNIDDSSRKKRKRKRKRKNAEPDKPDTASKSPAPKASPAKKEADKATNKSSRKKKKGRKGGPAVDEADVEKTLQETLRELELGASRARQRRRRQRRDERAEARERDAIAQEAKERVLRVTEFVSTGELANLMGVAVNELIGSLFTLGMIVSINQRLDADAISFLAEEYGYEVDFITEFSNEDIELEEDDPEDLEPRAPVITVMGHVDHGKTSLLDYIRNANVVAGEAGGITQHIGAYHITLENGRDVTFLDTPGHEAFTAMRARGAQVTDLVILVVAADDSVMPQTIEAINHAQAADVPLVVAINKIDKAGANTQKVMAGLAEHGVLVEPYGGDVQTSMVSAITGEGIDDLLEKGLLEADLLELQANEDRNAIGTVIESRLEKGRGNVATVLVQNGSLRVGDTFIAGIYSGRVRAMFDERDHNIGLVGPSRPALILGFEGAPEVGDQFIVLADDREARSIAQKRQQIHREQSLRQRKHITLDEIGRRLALGDFQELNIIIKGDVMGSIEALSDSLLKLSTDEVQLNIIHSGVGAISESDVMLASASDAVIIGFQVRPSPSAREAAEREEIDIRLYSIIYDAIEDVHDALEGLLSPEESEKILGVAEVRETFKVPKVGTIAGCFISEGKIRRSDTTRLIRDGVVIYNGVLSSLKRFKDDVREVSSGYECGIGIQNYNDIKVGDMIEAYEIVETRRKLEV